MRYIAAAFSMAPRTPEPGPKTTDELPPLTRRWPRIGPQDPRDGSAPMRLAPSSRTATSSSAAAR